MGRSSVGEIDVALLSEGFDLGEGERVDWAVSVAEHEPPC
jgi:hypothetical protein